MSKEKQFNNFSENDYFKDENFYNQAIFEFLQYNGFEDVAEIYQKELKMDRTNQNDVKEEQIDIIEKEIRKKVNKTKLCYIKSEFLENIRFGISFDIMILRNYDLSLILEEKILNYIKRLFILEIIENEEWEKAFLILDGKYYEQTQTNLEQESHNLKSDNRPTNEQSKTNKQEQLHLDCLIHGHLRNFKLTIQVNDLLQHIIYKTKPDISKEREMTAELINQLIMTKQDKECSLLEAVKTVGLDILVEKMKMNKSKMD